MCAFRLPHRPGEAKERRSDLPARLRASFQTARHLRATTRAVTMADRDFQNPHPRSRRAHLHFEIPSICLFAHPEAIERVAPDRPQRAHIRISDTVERVHGPSCEVAGHELLNAHAAVLAHTPRGGPHAKILSTPEHWTNPPRR